MASKEEIVASILNLSEDEFFNADRAVLEPRESELLDMDFFGLAVNGPRKIPTDRQDRLPLIMAAGFTGERDWDIPLADNCLLVGTNLQDGTVHFGSALVTEKEQVARGIREKPPRGPKPSGLALGAAQLTAVDVRGRLPVTWNTGTWALGVISYDWPSNTVVVELEGDEAPKPATAPPVSPEPDPRGVAALPNYLPSSKTPQSPPSGVAFTGEFGMEEGRQRLSIFGAFSVLVRDFHVPDKLAVHAFQDGRQENVVAVIPVTLAVLGVDWPDPMRFDWAVPVYGPQVLEPGMPAQGFFAVDAFAEDGPQFLDPGKYVCYIILDGGIFGPKTLQVS
jgi:hypothetical protein